MSFTALSPKPRYLWGGCSPNTSTVITAGGVYVLRQAVSAALQGQAGSGQSVVDIYAPDYDLQPKGSFLRIRARCFTNATPPTSSWYFALYPVASVGGAAGANFVNVGTEVVGSATPTITTPPASTILPAVESADFAVPADGLYVVALVAAGAWAVGAAVIVEWNLGVLNL